MEAGAGCNDQPDIFCIDGIKRDKPHLTLCSLSECHIFCQRPVILCADFVADAELQEVALSAWLVLPRQIRHLMDIIHHFIKLDRHFSRLFCGNRIFRIPLCVVKCRSVIVKCIGCRPLCGIIRDMVVIISIDDSTFLIRDQYIVIFIELPLPCEFFHTVFFKINRGAIQTVDKRPVK